MANSLQDVIKKYPCTQHQEVTKVVSVLLLEDIGNCKDEAVNLIIMWQVGVTDPGRVVKSLRGVSRTVTERSPCPKMRVNKNQRSVYRKCYTTPKNLYSIFLSINATNANRPNPRTRLHSGENTFSERSHIPRQNNTMPIIPASIASKCCL